MTGLDIKWSADSKGECKQGCGRQDNTCQVYNTLKAIRKAHPLSEVGIDPQYFEHMLSFENRMANRRDNM